MMVLLVVASQFVYNKHFKENIMKLVTKQVEQGAIAVDTPTHRILVVDCSGSMSYELPKLRQHLKNKLPTMVQPQDTLSIIWFSGPNQCGLLFENMSIDSLQDLTKINAAVDRFLQPTGMTAFKDPLDKVIELTTKNTHSAYTMSFMTDGANNSGSKSVILDVCTKLADKLSSATFVEYGFYADHKMLMDMAEEVGGQVVLADNFTTYSESLESTMKVVSSSKKVKVNLRAENVEFVVGNLLDGFVIARPDAVGLVTLPANTQSYSYFESGASDTVEVADDQLNGAAYMVSALIQRGNAQLAMTLASAIGDRTLYESIENAFSKQDYVLAVETGNAFGAGKKQLFESEERDTNLIPDPNAYNVLTLLMDLADTEGNFLDLSHPDFDYVAGGGERDTVVSTDGYTPKFKDAGKEIKAEIKALKFDEDRPNINILVNRPGTVNLPKNELGFKDEFDTFIWRSYSIVRDGIVNVRKLPVVLSKATYDLLSMNGIPLEPFKIGKTYVIDTKKLPVINRSMVTKSSSTEMFKDCFQLYKLRVTQKVLGDRIEKPEFGQKFGSIYGEEGAKFLKEIGITEGGFSPKSVKGESLDPYTAKVLEIKMAGLSSIPKVSDVRDAITKGKTLTPSQAIMRDVFVATDKVEDVDIADVLKSVKGSINNARDKIIKKKFGIIIGKVWFSDMINLEDNSRELDFGLGKMIKCTACLEDKVV
jgi:hypothetical protein